MNDRIVKQGLFGVGTSGTGREKGQGQGGERI
jgi:hypothetical protein